MTSIQGRRAFLLGLAAMLASADVPAQRSYRVAILVHGSARSYARRFEALRTALKGMGYAEGRNLTVVARWNEGPLDRLPNLAAELLRENPDVFVCGPTLASAAVHKHSRTVPVVQANGAGAVKIGLAESFARPGGNVTGVETQTEELTAKHIELIRTIAPGLSRLGVLNTGNFLFHEEAWVAARKTADAMKIRLVDVRVGGSVELSRLRGVCGKGACDALYVMADPDMINWRTEIVEQVARLSLPAVYFQPEFVRDGGLISYSADVEDMWRRAAGYVDRILKGAKPADLPIERPLKFELLINRKTARALGLTVPGDLLARADQVIE
jgi:putative ABC transport system substrate-binding protein